MGVCVIYQFWGSKFRSNLGEKRHTDSDSRLNRGQTDKNGKSPPTTTTTSSSKYLREPPGSTSQYPTNGAAIFGRTFAQHYKC